MEPVLIGLPYSPWSERARWALDARGISYKRQRYQPLLGEPGLRMKLRQWSGPVSVPVLLTDEGPIPDSTQIAQWADSHGDGPVLFPEGREADVLRWVERAQQGMSAGRALSLTRVLARPDAVDELSPPWVRKLGSIGRAVTRSGVARTRRKYGGGAQSDGDHQRVLESVLDELRAAIGSRTTLLDAFSYADIAAAQVLCFVEPPDRKWLRLGPANQAAFGDPALAERYRDVVSWRDALYARYRDRTAQAAA